MSDPSSQLSILAVIGAIVVAVGGGIYFGRGPDPLPPQPAAIAEPVEQTVVVHVSGAVRNPGLVSLPIPARIADAIEAAGGASNEADIGALNLAGPLRDGEQIVVPAYGESQTPDDGGVDLNRATASQLVELIGIGPVLAERIVVYREKHGPFEAIEDLLDVPGIGEAKLALLRPGVSAP
ncbi:MAG: hypothetical protein BMS9Abin07_0595 [Acidimicrobiia bacterium]|nr:MAG: hypothetical protein BMS9Abin07_0595 [Acidimicrobiia bacterium]